jgi:hypothetical protein
MRSKVRVSGVGTLAGGWCGCVVFILILNLTLGAFCFDYSLYSIVGKDIPWTLDAVCGLFLGEFTIPCALVCCVLRHCDIETPFIDVDKEE